MKKIPVTKSFLPDIDQFKNEIDRIWKNQWLTNRGELVCELENKLKSKLDIDNLLLTCNGTIPLQIALKIFGKNGQVITTPFSYVATTSSIVWEGCTPIFIDINKETLNIEPSEIEKAITTKTTCILATHVFGNPCDIESIEKIANKYNLTVIYDSAHAFGTKYKGKSIFKYGDISTCSFHATKLFHTGEGGAIIDNTGKNQKKIFSLHNFGHKGKYDFDHIGINAKMSEIHAALGLSNFLHIDKIIENRIQLVKLYLKYLDTGSLQLIKINEETEWNHSYFPVILNSEKILLRIIEALAEKNIFPRRYFYPSLNCLPYLKYIRMPISEDIATRIICLPLYFGLSEDDIKFISKSINDIITRET